MPATSDRLATILARVARDGAARAGRGLTGLVGQEVTIHVPSVRAGTRRDACDAVGGAESVVLGAYLGMTGDITGHVMLLFPEERALRCVDRMCAQEPGTAEIGDELTRSAVAELANIVGSAFVNALADQTALVLQPNPPAVVHDMAVALVETVYAEILSHGADIVMIDTVFEDRTGATSGLLIVAPDPPCLARLAELVA